MKFSSKMTALVIVAATLLSGCGNDTKKSEDAKSIKVHVGGTMRPVITRLAKDFSKETGYEVEINSAGSGELLAHIDMQKEGDVYVCHDPFMDILMKKFKMGVNAWTISELIPCIVVQKGNPKNIKGLKDLTRKDVKLYLTDFKRSTLGRMLNTIFDKAGIKLDEMCASKEVNTHKSGSYVANMVKMKNADAAMVWTAVAALRRDALDVVDIPMNQLPTPGVDAITSATGKAYPLRPVRVTLNTLKCAKNPEIAEKFAQYVISAKVAPVFREFGYVIDGIKQDYKDGKEIK